MPPLNLSNSQDPVDDLMKLGKALVQSGMFGLDNPGAGVVLVIEAMTQGTSLLDIAATYNFIKGRPSMRADTMLARYMGLGGKVQWVETTDAVARALWTHGEHKGYEVGLTLKEACAAYDRPTRTGTKFTDKDSPWVRTPQSMLRARVISMAIRMIMPEAIHGVYTPEEVAEFTDMPTQKAKPILDPETPTPAPAPAPTPTSAAEPTLDDFVDRVLPELGAAELLIPAEEFARVIGWLPEDGSKTLEHVSDAIKLQIIQDTKGFMTHIEAHLAKKGN